MTIIGLVRHGVTDWNLEGRMQGKNDIPLNAEGRKQAELLGKRLSGETWDRIYSSDMSRARETADIIGRYMGQTVEHYDPRLAERTFGLLEGTTEAERMEKWGPNWREIDHQGESKEAVERRALDFLEEMDGKHPGQRILIVSHGAVIGTLIDKLFPELGYQGLRNTCVNIIQRKNKDWTCLLHNCTKHLERQHG